MPGIIFFRSDNIREVESFYVNKLGFKVWFKNRDCLILKNGNLLIGIQKGNSDDKGIITLLLNEPRAVDNLFHELKEFTVNEPRFSEDCNTYECYIRDPENRLIRVMSFLNKSSSYLTGEELLLTRRSIREFEDRDVPEEILWKIFELSRWAPTSKNSQSYYFVVIKRKEILAKLASLRGRSSSPIGKAPIAVAICSDPSKSKRYVQDACIAAYHFILACWIYGLGTCWIAAMDRDDVKELLNIPKNHYIATITPVGYPKYVPNPPLRKPVNEFVKILV